jgi:hypothetical protein
LVDTERERSRFQSDMVGRLERQDSAAGMSVRVSTFQQSTERQLDGVALERVFTHRWLPTNALRASADQGSHPEKYL